MHLMSHDCQQRAVTRLCQVRYSRMAFMTNAYCCYTDGACGLPSVCCSGCAQWLHLWRLVGWLLGPVGAWQSLLVLFQLLQQLTLR